MKIIMKKRLRLSFLVEGLSPRQKEIIARKANDKFEDSKISSFVTLCENFVTREKEVLRRESNLVRWTRIFSFFTRNYSNPELKSLTPYAQTTLKTADLIAKDALLEKDKVPTRLVVWLTRNSDHIHLQEMADYAEMCERFGLNHLQRVITASIELGNHKDAQAASAVTKEMQRRSPE